MKNLFSVGLLAARLIVGGIFLIAGIDKVQAPGAFADAVRAFHMLPPSLVLPFAFVVPWVEILVAVYLVAGFLSRWAAVASILLLGSFVFALSVSIVQGTTNHACGCFGASAGNPIMAFLSGGGSITWWDIIRDVLLIGMSAAVLVYGSGYISVDGFLAARREAALEVD